MGTNSKQKQYYLVFDDNPEAESLYQNKVNINTFDCEAIYINPIPFYNVDDDFFDKTLFLKNIKNKSKNRFISLILTDWNLIDSSPGFSGLKGWDIIECVIEAKPVLQDRRFMIYSNNIDEASTYVVDKIKKDIENDSTELDVAKQFLKTILGLKIKFCKNSNERYQETINILKESNTISSVVLNTIKKYEKNKVVDYGNDTFKGKLFSKIISDDKNPYGLKFVRELIELAIANYTEFNDE